MCVIFFHFRSYHDPFGAQRPSIYTTKGEAPSLQKKKEQQSCKKEKPYGALKQKCFQKCPIEKLIQQFLPALRGIFLNFVKTITITRAVFHSNTRNALLTSKCLEINDQTQRKFKMKTLIKSVKLTELFHAYLINKEKSVRTREGCSD